MRREVRFDAVMVVEPATLHASVGQCPVHDVAAGAAVVFGRTDDMALGADQVFD
jgi:hypothetical protein